MSMKSDYKHCSLEDVRKSLISQIERALAIIEDGGGKSSLEIAEMLLDYINEPAASIINKHHFPDEILVSNAKGPANLIKAAISVIDAQRLLNSNKPLEAIATLNDAYYYIGATATITLVYSFEALAMISKCPLVMGSNVPG